jgi:hypothetical protein
MCTKGMNLNECWMQQDIVVCFPFFVSLSQRLTFHICTIEQPCFQTYWLLSS